MELELVAATEISAKIECPAFAKQCTRFVDPCPDSRHARAAPLVCGSCEIAFRKAWLIVAGLTPPRAVWYVPGHGSARETWPSCGISERRPIGDQPARLMWIETNLTALAQSNGTSRDGLINITIIA